MSNGIIEESESKNVAALNVAKDIASSEAPKPKAASHASLVENRTFWSKTLNVIAYPLGVIAAFYTSDTLIRRSAYSNFAKSKHFSDLQAIENAAKAKVIEAVKIDKTIKVADEIAKIHDTYRFAVRNRFINEWGIKNGLWDYWKCLHKNQRIEAGMYAFTAAAITIGGLLSVSDHVGMVKDILFDKDKTPDDNRPMSR